MQIKKALVNDRLRFSKVFWKFRISTIYNFKVIYPWNLLFFEKVAYFLTVSIVFSVYEQNLKKAKTWIAMKAKNSVFVIFVEAIIYLLLHNLHNCTFNKRGNIEAVVPEFCLEMLIWKNRIF